MAKNRHRGVSLIDTAGLIGDSFFPIKQEWYTRK